MTQPRNVNVVVVVDVDTQGRTNSTPAGSEMMAGSQEEPSANRMQDVGLGQCMEVLLRIIAPRSV
jgi:hypothetical protein